jgi:superfamily II DNA or RNA helicase
MNKVKLKIKDLGKVLSAGLSPKIDSPYGKVHITDSYVKYGIGYDMHLSNGEVVRCAENHKMLGLDDFVDAKDYSVGDFFHGGDVFLEKKTDVGYQDWYDFSVDHEQESYTHKGIVHHNSGKSLIIYCLIRWILDTNPDNRLVLIVPNVQLVEQMYADFQDYSGINDFEVSKAFQRLYAGKSKNVVAPVLISTWQSLSSIIKATDASILTSFTGVIVDEAHGATGKELQKILEQMTNASYRIGTTGTIQSEKVHKLVVEGFLGPSYQVITTKKLIDNKQVSGIKIRPVVLEYPIEDKDFCKKMDYQDETSFIISHQSRLTKVSKLTAGLPGTTLLLVSRRDDHAVPLYDEIKKYSKKPVYFVAGTVDAEDREEIRLKANTEDCIIVATYKTMSTGTNIPNIRNVVFGSTSKAMITILQSIGRGLRLHSDKESMLLIDFIDDLRYKKHENYAYQHSEVRMRIYRKEQFEISQPVKVML